MKDLREPKKLFEKLLKKLLNEENKKTAIIDDRYPAYENFSLLYFKCEQETVIIFSLRLLQQDPHQMWQER